MGWALSGLSSIDRCPKTLAEDADDRAVTLDLADRYCLGGNKLRLTSGSYGTNGSEYQTQIATFSRIRAIGVMGSGPQSFTVEEKGGLIYEYGNTVDSRVLLGGSTVYSWLLSKVRDRSGNSYVVAYNNSPTLGTVPATISWSPTTAGGSNYQYQIAFTYSPKSNEKDAVYAYAAGVSVANRNRLDLITMGYSASGSGYSTKRQYVLTYDTSATTGLNRLTNIKECGATTSTCLLPTVVGYQGGAAGVVPTSTSALASSSSVQLGRYDFNGDGKSDLVYFAGSTWKVALSTGAGFASPIDTGITTAPIINRFLATRQDGFLVNVGGNWSYVSYNGSGFTTTATGTGFNSGTLLSDNNGDGLADLIWVNGPSVMLRLNTTTANAATPTFSSTVVTAITFSLGPNGGSVALLDVSKCPLQRMCDLNGDSRSDWAANVTTTFGCGGMGGCTPTQTWYDLYSSGTGYVASVPNPGSTQTYTGLYFNDDACIDKIVAGTSTLRISGCNNTTAATVSLPAVPSLVMDWDGDGNTDLIVNNGGTIGVYLSNGSISSPFGGLTVTSIPFNSSCNYAVMDMDGDRLDDLECVSTISPFPVNYSPHNGGGTAGTAGGAGSYATQLPDVASSITEGYGIAVSPSYVSTAQSNYVKGSGTALPMADQIEPTIVVARVGISDGLGSTYTQTYNYKGARRHSTRGPLVKVGEGAFGEERLGIGGEWAGFEEITVLDSRNAQLRRMTYDQVFPLNGMLKQDDLFQADQTTLISSSTYINNPTVLESGAFNQRYFPSVSRITTNQYEVSSDVVQNGRQLTSTVQDFAYAITTYGNLTSQSTEVTDKDIYSPYYTKKWTTAVANTYALVDSVAIANWCIGLTTQVVMTYSSDLSGVPTVARTTGFTPDAANPDKCRISAKIVEPGNGQYSVTENYVFDAFGNISSIGVVGREPQIGGGFGNMPTRTRDTYWGVTGQFPTSITDASGAISAFAYNLSTGTLQKVTDPNSTLANTIETSFLYDEFNRKKRETRPDGTYTTWAYSDCSPNCVYSIHKASIAKSVYDKNGVLISDEFYYVDALERPLVTRSRLLNGTSWDSSYRWQEVQYDALGRITKTFVPCSTTSATLSCRNSSLATTSTYDAIGRLLLSSRPRTATDLTAQDTTYTYAGRVQTYKDALLNVSTRTADVTGAVRQTTDPNNYSINFTYDAAGSQIGVSDSLANTLLWGVTMNYGIAAFQVAATDSDLGASTRTYNSLGDLLAWTKNGQSGFSASYDSLSRPLTRVEPDNSTTWVWGASKTDFNYGQLQSVSSTADGLTYTESYAYDSRMRLQTKFITIPGQTTYQFGYTYEPDKGWLNTLTYPTAGGAPLRLQYAYQNGMLQKVFDADIPTSEFWTAKFSDPSGQLTEEALGNNITTKRVFEPVTGRLDSIKSGPVGNDTGVQSASFAYDLIGNVTQRQNAKLSLTENYVYGSGSDHLYRLCSATVIGAATPLTITYDALGNIRTKSDVAGGAAWTYDPAHPHRLTQAGDVSHIYSYDANGNVISRNGSTMSWTSYNYPRSVSTSTESASFSYGPDRQRWKMVYTNGAQPVETTYYVGQLFERVETVGLPVEYRHTIMGGGAPVAIVSRISGVTTTRYVLGDHQGNVETLADSAGAPITTASFTPFGERRNATTWSGGPANRTVLDGITRQGYTFQTVLGAMGLNHMNGRVQDAVTGRFLSADPFVMQPAFTQNYNRYSYVYNNPVSFTDPTGFEAKAPNPCVGAGSACSDAKAKEAADAAQKARDSLPSVIVTGFKCGATCMQTVNQLLSQWYSYVGSLKIGGPNASLPSVQTDDTGRDREQGGRRTGKTISTVTCPSVVFKVSGVGPDQAPGTASISQTSRADIPNGGVAIKPRNFGGSGRGVFAFQRPVYLGVRLYVDWSSAQPSWAPNPPQGLPTEGPFTPVDTMGGPAAVVDGAENQIDAYNYASQDNALSSTRWASVTAVIPRNSVGVSCPKSQPSSGP